MFALFNSSTALAATVVAVAALFRPAPRAVLPTACTIPALMVIVPVKVLLPCRTMRDKLEPPLVIEPEDVVKAVTLVASVTAPGETVLLRTVIPAVIAAGRFSNMTTLVTLGSKPFTCCDTDTATLRLAGMAAAKAARIASAVALNAMGVVVTVVGGVVPIVNVS